MKELSVKEFSETYDIGFNIIYRALNKGTLNFKPYPGVRNRIFKKIVIDDTARAFIKAHPKKEKKHCWWV